MGEGGPAFASLPVCVWEVEVILEADQEEAGAQGDHLGPSDPRISDPGTQQSIMPRVQEGLNRGPVCSYAVAVSKEETHGQEEVKAASSPQSPRRRWRPRVQRGLTAHQLEALERVFQHTRYPSAGTWRALARRLFLAESRVKRWFKLRRARDRKRRQAAEMAAAGLGGQVPPD